jgi:hypothetical protein
MSQATESPFTVAELPFASIGGQVRHGPAAPSLRPQDPLGHEVVGPDGVPHLELDRFDVDRIVSIDADLVRVRSIALGYHLLSGQVGRALRLQGLATWWTFAVWALATIAWSIDPRHGWRPPEGADDRRPSWLRRVAGAHKLTVSNQFLAQANRYVFAEMGALAVDVGSAAPDVLAPHEKSTAEFEDDLSSFLATVQPTLRADLFGPGRHELLHHGVATLFQAARTEDADRRAGLVYVSNMAFFEYEQRRLQQYLEVLLSSRPLHRWVELRDLTAGGTGPVATRLASARSRLATRYLKLQLPDREVCMADVSPMTDGAVDAVDLADAVYLSRWTGGQRRGDQADADWRDLRWRMRRMGAVFWKERRNRRLHECPFPEAEVADVRHGRDPRNIDREPDDHVQATASDHRWDHRLLDDLRRQGDRASRELSSPVDPSDLAWPEAVDAWVARHLHLELHEMLRVLAGDDPLPEETIDDVLREQLLDRPADRVSWLDATDTAEAFRRSRAFFRSHLPAIGVALTLGSLPSDMAAADGALVLHQTGYFRRDASARIERTTQFFLDVMNTGGDRNGAGVLSPAEETHPLGDPDGPALRAIRRTRITHQLVRSWIAAQSRGDVLDAFRPRGAQDLNGRPINLEDQLGTLLSLTVAMWESLANLGVDPDVLRTHEEDWYRAWCTIATNLGMADDVLPHSTDDARRLMWLLAWRHLRPSQAGFELGRAFVRELPDVFPSPFSLLVRPVAPWFATSAIRAVTEPPDRSERDHPWSVADMLALRRSPLPPPVARAVLRASTGEGRVALPRELVTRLILNRYRPAAPRMQRSERASPTGPTTIG